MTKKWWSRTDSFAKRESGGNLGKKNGGVERTRTVHLSNANAALYQMSYYPNRYYYNTVFLFTNTAYINSISTVRLSIGH